ncbi:MAG: FdtA/QdtA family cupin domain-containing protein [Candidatus Acidiferrum sp.]
MPSQAKPAKIASSLTQVASIEFVTHSEPARGHLTVLQYPQSIPFPIERIFYIRGIPDGSARGAHAHYDTEQVLIAVAGSFSLDVTDGQSLKTFELRTASRGVYIPTMMWVSMRDFSGDAVCLVLASAIYEPTDYIRDWDRYKDAIKSVVQ